MKIQDHNDLNDGDGNEEGGNNNDAMMLMAGDGELELLVSLDVLQTVNNQGSNHLHESRLCKGTLMAESAYLYNAYTINNFITIAYDPVTDCVFTTTVVCFQFFCSFIGRRRE